MANRNKRIKLRADRRILFTGQGLSAERAYTRFASLYRYYRNRKHELFTSTRHDSFLFTCWEEGLKELPQERFISEYKRDVAYCMRIRHYGALKTMGMQA